MDTQNYLTHVYRVILFCFLVLASSCTDHEVPGNLPGSDCKAVDGSDRLYPCEFVIENITFLAKDGTGLATVTGSLQSTSLSRFLAKTNTYAGSVVGQNGVAIFDVRITVKRVASPSFPVDEGYLFGYTHNSSGKYILLTPSFPGDTYGERSHLGLPVTLDMAVGESRDVIVEMTFPYSIVDAGASGIIPSAFFTYTSFFVDNDVTSLMFDRTTDPYRFVGSVVEAYYEKLTVQIVD